MNTVKIIAIILCVITAVSVFTEIRYNLITVIALQFSKEKYSDFLADIDFEKSLESEPICIKDKQSENKSLITTDISSITHQLKMHKQISEEYNLSDVATADTDFEKVLQILDWMTQHTYYNGNQLRILNDNTAEILKYAIDKPFTNALNCRYKAIAFADCLVAIGIKAYPVCMLSSEFVGCHFTCHAYISELDKWCAFDPSFGCWFSDTEGNPVNMPEVREMFLKGTEPTVNGYNFNGTIECFEEYMNGFLKYCISNLSTWENNNMDGRNSKSFAKRKAFNAALPE